jgi:hypothetical protein
MIHTTQEHCSFSQEGKRDIFRGGEMSKILALIAILALSGCAGKPDQLRYAIKKISCRMCMA